MNSIKLAKLKGTSLLEYYKALFIYFKSRFIHYSIINIVVICLFPIENLFKSS